MGGKEEGKQVMTHLRSDFEVILTREKGKRGGRGRAQIKIGKNKQMKKTPQKLKNKDIYFL